MTTWNPSPYADRSSVMGVWIIGGLYFLSSVVLTVISLVSRSGWWTGPASTC